VIVKHMPLTAPQKSSFGRLAEYITDPQEKDVRVGVVTLTNCISDDVELAVLEIRNTQAQNTRSTADKTYHLMVSFRDGEQPDDATLKAIEERICSALGFADHQRMSAVHHDTDNLHIHIAINKIHPRRYTIQEPFNAYHTLGQLCEKLEREFGLERDNHTPNKTRSENRVADMERHSDLESLLGWVKRECKVQMEGAQSWEALHQVLRENGLQIHERANGLVITAENGVSVKASSVSREFSKTKLEQRYGAFQAAPERLVRIKPARRYEKKPLASKLNTTELYAKYKAAQATASDTRAAEWAKARARKDRLIEAAKRTGRLKRAAIKLVSAPAIGKKLMYTATSKALREEIDQVNKQYLKEREEIYKKYQRRTWADWLREQATAGDEEALGALRAREAEAGLKGDTIAAKGGSQAQAGQPAHDSITKKGTIIYSRGASAVRDDGDRLKVSKGADQGGLQAALHLAMERYGSRIMVNGSDAFKEKIVRAAVAANLSVTFDDDALERRRQVLTNSLTKENKDGHDNSRRRPDRARDGAARRAAAAARAGSAKHGSGQAIGRKSHVEKVGRKPPPAAKNGVRNLPELGVVRQSDRGQVLLPGDVPRHVEHQGAQPAHGVRRDLHRPGGVGAGPAPTIAKPKVKRAGSAPPPTSQGRVPPLSRLGVIVIGDRPAPGSPVPTVPGAPATPARPVSTPAKNSAPTIPNQIRTGPAGAAAEKYIAEREQKHADGFDIPKHVRYTADKDRTVLYAGLRQVDGQALALLKVGEEVQVLPVDEATASRLKRISLGTQLGVNSKGAIRKKGRSR